MVLPCKKKFIALRSAEASAVVAVITNETPLKLVALSAMVKAFAVGPRDAQSDWSFLALLIMCFFSKRIWVI